MEKEIQLREAKTLISLYFPRPLELMGCAVTTNVDVLKLKAVYPAHIGNELERTIVIEVKEDPDGDYYLSIYLESDPTRTFQREIDEFGSMFVLTDVWCCIADLFETIKRSNKVHPLPPARVWNDSAAFIGTSGIE